MNLGKDTLQPSAAFLSPPSQVLSYSPAPGNPTILSATLPHPPSV